jgi:hypothetical protein
MGEAAGGVKKGHSRKRGPERARKAMEAGMSDDGKSREAAQARAEAARQERLAAALRANLQRRKARSRAGDEGDEPA